MVQLPLEINILPQFLLQLGQIIQKLLSQITFDNISSPASMIRTHLPWTESGPRLKSTEHFHFLRTSFKRASLEFSLDCDAITCWKGFESTIDGRFDKVLR